MFVGWNQECLSYKNFQHSHRMPWLGNIGGPLVFHLRLITALRSGATRAKVKLSQDDFHLISIYEVGRCHWKNCESKNEFQPESTFKTCIRTGCKGPVTLYNQLAQRTPAYGKIRGKFGIRWYTLKFAQDVVLKSLFFVFCKFVFVVVRSVWRDFSTRDNDNSREIRERSPNVLIRRPHLLAYAIIRLNVVSKSFLSGFFKFPYGDVRSVLWKSLCLHKNEDFCHSFTVRSFNSL